MFNRTELTNIIRHAELDSASLDLTNKSKELQPRDPVASTGRRKKVAFTLAEVLITLGIIGVVAALTIPSLVQKYQEKQTVSALKKAYSTLQSAYTMAVQEYGTPANWNISVTAQGASNLISPFVPYLNVQKKCIGTSASDYEGCMPNLKYKYLNGNEWANLNSIDTEQKVVLADGALLSAEVSSADCSGVYNVTLPNKGICGLFYVDINGFKKPNQQGKDLFIFWVTKSGIIPLGLPQDAASTFVAQCKMTASGNACAAWVIQNENMDYLHCSDIAWGGKTKCD